jgi:hypothetical protein
MTGIPTTQRLRGCSVYVDHASDLSYIYHHIPLTSEKTVKGKEALEVYAKAIEVMSNTTMHTMEDLKIMLS